MRGIKKESRGNPLFLELQEFPASLDLKNPVVELLPYDELPPYKQESECANVVSLIELIFVGGLLGFDKSISLKLSPPIKRLSPVCV